MINYTRLVSKIWGPGHCDNHECKKYGKSIRAKVILNWIETFLSEKPFSSKEVYNHYVKEMKVVSIERAAQNQNSLLSFRSQMTGLLEKKQKIKDLMLEYHKDEKIKNVYMGDLLKLDADIEENQKNLDRVHSRITKEKHSILTYAEFIELFDTMATTLAQIQNMKDLDSLVKKMFLNFTIREKNITEFTLNVPFKALYDLKISTCAGGET